MCCANRTSPHCAASGSGLITNHTGLSRDGLRNVDLMMAAGIHVTALFSPEHGISGRQDDNRIQNGVDATTGIPVYSLYSAEPASPYGGNAEERRYAGLRHSGCRRSILHVFLHSSICNGGSGEAAAQLYGSRPAESDHGNACRGSDARSGSGKLCRLFCAAGAARPHLWGTGTHDGWRIETEPAVVGGSDARLVPG